MNLNVSTNNNQLNFNGLKLKKEYPISKDLQNAILNNKYLNSLAQKKDVIIKSKPVIDFVTGKESHVLNIEIKNQKNSFWDLFKKRPTEKNIEIVSNFYDSYDSSSKDMIKRLNIIEKEQSFSNPEIFTNNMYKI